MALKISTSRHRASGNGSNQVEPDCTIPIGQEPKTCEPVIKKRPSGLGLASFIVSIIASLFIFMLVVAAGVLTVTGKMTTTAADGRATDSVIAMALGLALFALIILDLIAMALGIAGLTQKNRLKVFSVLGIIFSVSVIIIVGLLMVIGLMAKAH